jgi:hypothetical protein
MSSIENGGVPWQRLICYISKRPMATIGDGQYEGRSLSLVCNLADGIAAHPRGLLIHLMPHSRFATYTRAEG